MTIKHGKWKLFFYFELQDFGPVYKQYLTFDEILQSYSVASFD